MTPADGPVGPRDARDRDWALVRFWGFIADRHRLGLSLGIDASARDAGELVALVVRRYGLVGIDRLVGQFAAILRRVPDGRLALVRDHLGLVPLYWGRRGDEVVADADLETVREEIREGGALDLDVIAAHLMPVNAWPGERTQFAGIRRVLPGTATVVDSDSSGVVRYFNPEHASPDLSVAPDAAVARVREAVGSAVADACAGRRVASHLSGGLDSGVVTALAQRELARAGDELVATYSWTPPLRPGVAEGTEQRILRLAERHLGLATRRISYEDSRAAGLLELDPLVFPQWGFLEYEWAALTDAASRGVDTVLSGWGGDDFVSARTPLDPMTWLRADRGSALRAHISRLAARSGRTRSVIGANAWRPTVAAAVPQSLLGRRRRIRAQERWPLWLESHAHIAAADLGGMVQRTAQDRMVVRHASMDIQWRTDTWWKAAHHHGVEYRYPLLDQRVVRAALSMPPWYFHGDGRQRWGFRQLAAEVLPAGCALNEDKSDTRRILALWSGDMWPDRMARNRAASPQLAELAYLQLANRVARWSGPEVTGAALTAALDRVCR